MVTLVKGALLTAAVSLALGGIASAQALTDGEFKCQRSVSKAGSKFVGSKAKCAVKCIAGARRVPPVNPFSHCYAPYDGATFGCITSAEAKFAVAIRKACDLALNLGTDCPECYSGGDCSMAGEAGARVQNIEGQVDSFGPGVFCEQPGADAAETACEQNTAKSLAKLVGSVNKCYDKCNANVRKGLLPTGVCGPPATDPMTMACINAADGKAILLVNKKCGDVGAIPDCSGTDDYPNGPSWVNLVEVAISGNIPGTYCPSPSGAFLD